jgi:hypothetical protein
MTKVRLWSDLHNEFGGFKVHPREDDHETIVVLAGDIDLGCTARKFVDKLVSKFRAVIYVPGNHEYYGRVIEDIDERWKKASNQIPNFHFLNPGEVRFQEVRFIGCTLWTDFRNQDPICMHDARARLNDYNQIEIRSPSGLSTWKLNPDYIANVNLGHRAFIEDKLQEPFEGKTVVVTHHAPTFHSIKPKYQNDPSMRYLNFAYANTGLEEWFEKYDFDYWFHGHVHSKQKHELFGKTIMANPRGYKGYEPLAKEWELLDRDAEVIEL